MMICISIPFPFTDPGEVFSQEVILMNLPSIVILLLVAAAVIAVIRHRIKAKKAGKGGCSCGCSGCANEGICHGEYE